MITRMNDIETVPNAASTGGKRRLNPSANLTTNYPLRHISSVPKKLLVRPTFPRLWQK
jgi:hypothetical protein